MNTLRISLIALGIALGLYACSTEEFEGPSIVVLLGEFDILDSLRVTDSNPDFSVNDVVGFHAEFNKEVDWTLVIEGQTTGSRKVITGFSSRLDSNAVVWTGGTSQVPFFTTEDCTVELTVLDEPDTMRTELTVTGTRVFDGIPVADFEEGIPEEALVFHQFSQNMTFDVAQDDPLMGANYFKMGGRMGWNEWMLGQIDFPLDLSAVTADAENFYLNLGVLSGMDGALATDQYVNILISESTAPFNDNTSNNGADVFTTDMEVYKYQIRPVDWIGWRYVAIPYSDFEVKSQGGDNVRTPADISAIRLQCQSCPSANANCPENADVDVRTDIDFVMFTENAPLLDQ